MRLLKALIAVVIACGMVLCTSGIIFAQDEGGGGDGGGGAVMSEPVESNSGGEISSSESSEPAYPETGDVGNVEHNDVENATDQHLEQQNVDNTVENNDVAEHQEVTSAEEHHYEESVETVPSAGSVTRTTIYKILPKGYISRSGRSAAVGAAVGAATNAGKSNIIVEKPVRYQPIVIQQQPVIQTSEKPAEKVSVKTPVKTPEKATKQTDKTAPEKNAVKPDSEITNKAVDQVSK